MSDDTGSDNAVTARFTAILAEQFQHQLSQIIETIDSRVMYHITPVKTDLAVLGQDMITVKVALQATNHDLKNVKIAVKETNRDIKSLRKAVGYAERKVDSLSQLVTTSYLATVRDDRKLLHKLDQRVSHLEKTGT